MVSYPYDQYKPVYRGSALSLIALLALTSVPLNAQTIEPSVLLPDPSVSRTSKLQLGLQELQQEYADFLASTADAPFVTSNTALPVNDELVTVDAVAVNDVAALVRQLRALGMRNIASAGFLVSGQLPVRALSNAATLRELRLMRPVYSDVRTGSVTSQGSPAMRAPQARFKAEVDGTGVLVGTLSDSFNCLGQAPADVAAGDLPGGIQVVLEGNCAVGSDEGRAMMQIVADVAPGASQAFHSATLGEAAMANAVRALDTAGAGVIVDDVGYLTAPFFQDGVIAQAVADVVSGGLDPTGEDPPSRYYFSSAGNSSPALTYEAPFRSTGAVEVEGGAVLDLHDFDPGPGADQAQGVSIPSGARIRISLQWDQPFASVSGGAGSQNDLDILLLSADGSVLVASSETANFNGDPLEILDFTNTTTATIFNIVIVKFGGGPNPGLLKYLDFGGRLTQLQHATGGSTIVGHSNAVQAMSIGAAFYPQTPFGMQLPPLLESFSSIGGTPILFDTAGNRLANPEFRSKPDLVAPDGGNNTFFGSDRDGDGLPNFSGTSAAAPHAAGVAALLYGRPDLVQAMKATAIDMDVPGIDLNTGSGLIDALAAVDYAPLVLTQNEWTMVSLPAIPPADKSRILDIFSPFITSTYGTDWIMVGWDPTFSEPDPMNMAEDIIGTYVALDEDAELEVGKGYWILQNTFPEVAITMPPGSYQPANDYSGCASQWGCFHIEPETAGPSPWNIIGTPMYVDGPAVDDILVDGGPGCLAPAACPISEANTAPESLAADAFITYDGAIDEFILAGPGANLDAWRGYWHLVRENGVGQPLRLNIPR